MMELVVAGFLATVVMWLLLSGRFLQKCSRCGSHPHVETIKTRRGLMLYSVWCPYCTDRRIGPISYERMVQRWNAMQKGTR